MSYSIEVDPVDHGPGYWKTQIVTILKDGEPIGNYEYAYSGTPPWLPFSQNGQDYALYAEHYTVTSVMALPSCEKIAGEEPSTWGFCPVEFTVYPDGMSGTVDGCVWGGPYGLASLDLSRISEGILFRGDPDYEDDEEYVEDGEGDEE